MKHSRRLTSALAFATVVIIGLAAWLLADREPAPTSAPPEEEATGEAPPLAPAASGREIPDLPRYPGSRRVGYETRTEGDLVSVEARYVTTAEPDAVREFYREVFEEEEWSVVDYDYTRGEWHFFVAKDEREAIVAFGPRGEATEIDIEFSEPREQTSGERT